MKQQNKFTMLDCGGRAEKLNHDFLRDLSFVSPNETELERITGEDIDLQDDIKYNLKVMAIVSWRRLFMTKYWPDFQSWLC